MRRNEIQKLLLVLATLTFLGCGGGSGGSSAETASAEVPDDGTTDGGVVDDGRTDDGITDDGTTDVDTTGGTGTTADVLCEFSQTVENDDESVQDTSMADWFCSDDVRTLSANGLPDHEVGTFPNENNPSAIRAQEIEVDFPLAPEVASEAGDAVRTVAYALNGVKFEVGTAGTCTDDADCSAAGGNGGTWRMEAVGENSFDFGNDDSNGHVQPTGQYHYHGIPEAYLEKLGKGEDVTLVGWATDGFPIYARYGYADASDADSEITVLRSSYALKSTPDEGRPDVGVYPFGAFTQDYEYVAGSGDLDECNGRIGVTPEFPGGIYHYYLTDTFPFGQRCVKGTPIGDAAGGGPPPA